MSAIKNGIKELHCKESLSGKRFKRSIAHNNLKLTCNIYHIQVFKLPFLPPDRSLSIRSPRQTGTSSQVFKQNSVRSTRMLKVMHCLSFCLISVMCILQRSANGEARRSTHVEGGGGGRGGGGEVRVALRKSEAKRS